MRYQRLASRSAHELGIATHVRFRFQSNHQNSVASIPRGIECEVGALPEAEDVMRDLGEEHSLTQFKHLCRGQINQGTLTCCFRKI